VRSIRIYTFRVKRKTDTGLKKNVGGGGLREHDNARPSSPTTAKPPSPAKRKRLRENPLIDLEPGNVELDRRRVRRALHQDEVALLLTATRASQKVFRGLTGGDRYMIYLLALGSGLRVSEIASLTPESFLLDDETPHVIVEAGTSKRRRRDKQPLQSDVAEAFREYLKAEPQASVSGHAVGLDAALRCCGSILRTPESPT
jgi:integrase